MQPTAFLGSIRSKGRAVESVVDLQQLELFSVELADVGYDIARLRVHVMKGSKYQRLTSGLPTGLTIGSACL